VIRLPSATRAHEQFLRDGFVMASACLAEPKGAAVIDAAREIAESSAVVIDRGSSAGGLAYGVVTGDQIEARAPLLFGFYTCPDLLSWIRCVTGNPAVSRSPHRLSAININCLTQPGQQYPLHRDAVPYTALLFLTDVPSSAGGEFLIDSLRGERRTIQPSAGAFVLMDGARCPHGALPLREAALRLTMPMVFPAAAAHLNRPEGLDEYLYGR
jgi:hypothetical protein